MENENDGRVCDVCDETGDKTCFTGTGICATENDETCDYCDNRATEICDTCGALLCNDHVVMGGTVVVGGVNISYTYCRKFACVNGMRVVNGVMPYITCA